MVQKNKTNKTKLLAFCLLSIIPAAMLGTCAFDFDALDATSPRPESSSIHESSEFTYFPSMTPHIPSGTEILRARGHKGSRGGGASPKDTEDVAGASTSSAEAPKEESPAQTNPPITDVKTSAAEEKETTGEGAVVPTEEQDKPAPLAAPEEKKTPPAAPAVEPEPQKPKEETEPKKEEDGDEILPPLEDLGEAEGSVSDSDKAASESNPDPRKQHRVKVKILENPELEASTVSAAGRAQQKTGTLLGSTTKGNFDAISELLAKKTSQPKAAKGSKDLPGGEYTSVVGWNADVASVYPGEQVAAPTDEVVTQEPQPQTIAE